MVKKFSILFVSSEIVPFAKESGVGDVSYSLSLAIRDLGHDVRVMMPKYGTISERKNRIHEINRLRDVPIKVGDIEELATIKSSSINNPKNKVQAYITTNKYFFDDKKGVYHDPKTWELYDNNAERFSFFNKSVIETCLLLGWFPDIIHCNDWQSALVPALIKEKYPEEFKNTKVVFTIHNFNNQGVFEIDDFEKTGLPKSALTHFKHKNKINFMKGGIHYSDYITTVSEVYAEEIVNDKQYSNDLNKFLNKKTESFKGILNGIDTYTWNPKKDKLIKSKLGSDFEEYKYNNKVALTQKFELDFKPNAPLLAMIPRIGSQKGVPLLIEAADELFKNDIQMILLGQGDAKLKKELTKIAKQYPDKFKVKFEFDDNLSHLIEAGSDMFLMPSEYEPCGLNLMYSMNYGSVPIVRATGGLKQAAKQYEKDTKEGNAFVFQEYNSKDFLAKISEALEMFKDKDEWMNIINNGLSEDFSWDKSAEEYVEIYKELLK
jgi:starch synthase